MDSGLSGGVGAASGRGDTELPSAGASARDLSPTGMSPSKGATPTRRAHAALG